MSTPTRSARPAAPVGLTAAGVAVILFAASLFGLLVDVFTGNGVGWIFGVVFIAASTYAALQVRRIDFAAALITPPLVFAVLVVGYKIISSSGEMLTKVVAGMNGLLDDGPMLWIGTGLAVLIVCYRLWQERRHLAPTSFTAETSFTAAAPLPSNPLPSNPLPFNPLASNPLASRPTPSSPAPSVPGAVPGEVRTTDAPPPS